MQPPCTDLCQNLRAFRPFLGFSHCNPSPSSKSLGFCTNGRVSSICCRFESRKTRIGDRSKGKSGGRRMGVNGKENVWSIDNELAKAETEAEEAKQRKRMGRRSKSLRKRHRKSSMIVSSAMLIEIETVLQTQEPIIKPLWSTFVSSVSGIWEGVGAVFSPNTAKMEPVGLGSKDEKLYDCYTLSHIEQVLPISEGLSPQIQRKVNWVFLNPYGEMKQPSRIGDTNKEAGKVGDGSSIEKGVVDVINSGRILPSFESFDFSTSEILEEDLMGMEPGLVFFEDGSYSRGPMEIPVGEYDEDKYFLSPTFKFEQCLVKGCHKRLRIVHTIEFIEGGSNIEITRVAVYEEQWVSPTSLHDNSDLEFDLKPFSQRRRTQPSELTGSWKVFEVSATPILGEETTVEEGKLPYVYLCMETMKKRSLPGISTYFGEEEILDMQDTSILWLPGGVTAHVDVKKDGILCIGVGWYSNEGINLVMERDYGTDGKLKEVRWKSELKRRWSDDSDHPLPV